MPWFVDRMCKIIELFRSAMIKVIVVILCLGLNAFLSAIEMAFVTLGLPHLKQLKRSGDADASRLIKFRENPERTLSILQVGITLVGSVSAAVTGAGAHELLSPWVQAHFHVSDRYVDLISIAMLVVPLTYVSVVAGELVPKTLALRNPIRVALFGSRIMQILDELFSPIISSLEWSTRIILRMAKISGEVIPKSGDEISIDNLSAQHQQYVINLVDLEKKRISDVMLPWNQVITAHINQTIPEVSQAFFSSGHTRLPVCDDNNVIGILHAKEFMAFREAGATDWKSLVRNILKIKETESILRSLRMMQVSRRHLGLVLSKENVLIGIITLEDIIEEIVGDIYDEDDDGAVRSILAASAAFKLHSRKR